VSNVVVILKKAEWPPLVVHPAQSPDLNLPEGC
jgi:hypothetical protein